MIQSIDRGERASRQKNKPLRRHKPAKSTKPLFVGRAKNRLEWDRYVNSRLEDFRQR